MMSVATSDAGTWDFSLVGYPLWLVLPLAAVAIVAISRLGSSELEAVGKGTRRGLFALRGCVAALLLLYLTEPTCTYTGSETELPTIAVLLDTSGSMSVKDEAMSAHHRLNEASALGLVPDELRDTTAMRAAEEVESILIESSALISALTLSQNAAAAEGQETEDVLEEARDLAEKHAEQLKELAPGVAGLAGVSAGLADIRSLLEQIVEVLAGDSDETEKTGSARAEILIQDLRGLQQNGREVARRCREAQRFSDAALVSAAEEGSPIASGLAALGKLSRFERAKSLIGEKLEPIMEKTANIKMLAMDRKLEPLDAVFDDNGNEPLLGQTDLEAPLAALAGSSSSERLAGVLLVSDGRQTSGNDPVGAARAIGARGTKLGAVLVGDPDTPRDAVVSEIIGSTGVFRGETVRLDVRFRISGFQDETWELVLSRPGKEIERRNVEGTGRWQQERFEFPADEPGIMQMTARLERTGGPVDTSGHGILREYWTGIGGGAVTDLTGSAHFNDAPDGAEVVGSFASPKNWADNYGTRMRGYVVPPLTGSYTFWISSDDGSELWLSTDRSSERKTLICKVDGWTPALAWDTFPTQKSKPISLRAGERYYVEALQKEGSGEDNIAVGWQLPDSTLERPIPGERLLPYKEGEEDEGEPDVDLPEASQDNNHAQIVVSVSEDPLKALLVDALPRWESRYIVTMFERDRRVELVRRYRSIALPQGRTELLPPTQEELDGYDVVVLGDLRPQELSPEDQQRLESFVSRRGGFLIVLAGPRGMPSDYNLGGIADLLPVRSVPGDGSDARGRTERITLTLGDAATGSAITAVLDDPALNSDLWPALPPLTWVARNVAAKTGAEVLVETDDEHKTPVAALMRHGAGRVIYMGTDETWRWRDRLGDRVHQTFWLQALRWGLGERLRGKDQRLQVSLDRALMAPGETAELRARARALDGTPIALPPKVRIESLDTAESEDDEEGAETDAEEKVRELELGRVVDSRDTGRVPVEGLDEGRWLLTVTSDDPRLAGLSETREVVVRRAHGLEAIELGADLAMLQKLATAGGFRAGGFAEAEKIAREMAQGLEARVRTKVKAHRLWDGYAALGAVLVLLAIEWVWRKRLGLP